MSFTILYGKVCRQMDVGSEGGLARFFMDKNLPIMDISAWVSVFGYDTGMTNKEHLEVTIMRHVYIRGIIGLIWIAAAAVSGVSGNFEMSALYVILGGVFLYFAYTTRKKDKDSKGGR